MLHLPHGTIIMSQLKNDDSFTKRDFRPFQNAAQVNQILLRLPRKITSKTTHLILTHACRRCHARHADEKVSDVLYLARKKTFWTSRCPQSTIPATKNRHSSKNGYHAPGKMTPSEETNFTAHTLREPAQSKCPWTSHASLCRQTLGPTESIIVRTYCKHTVWGIKWLVALITLLLRYPW